MSYPLSFTREALADLDDLPDLKTKIAAFRAAQDLSENPHRGKPLRARLRVGDLRGCRVLAFDREGWAEKPRFRLVYYNDPNDGSIAVVRVIAVGLRAQLAAYKAAAARMRKERRRQLGE